MAVLAGPQSLGWAQDAPVQATQRGQAAALRDVERSTVRVFVLLADDSGQLVGLSTGSGFVVAPGKVVTNHHVIAADGTTATRRKVIVVPHRDVSSEPVESTVVRDWAEGDLALLDAPGLAAQPIAVASAAPGKDEPVHAVGYPGVTDKLLGRTPEQLLVPAEPSVTSGSISLFSDRGLGGAPVEVIFHTAAINHGNSGGPLVDACGRVIGVNTWGAAATISEQGGIDVPNGQFIASRASNLLKFLNAAYVTPTVVDQACVPPLDPRVEAILKKQQAELDQANKARTDDAAAAALKAKADAAGSNRTMLIAAAAALALFAIVGLIFVLVRRRPTAPSPQHPHPVHTPPSPMFDTPEAQAAATPSPVQHHAPVRPKGGPSLLVLGLIGLVLALAAALVFIALKPAAKPTASPADVTATATPTSNKLVCKMDKANSDNPVAGSESMDFTFDPARACANNRTPYEKTSDGFVRVTLGEKEQTVARLEVSSDLKTFRRSDYSLSPESFAQFKSLRDGLGTIACPAGEAGVNDVSSQLAKVRRLSSDYVTNLPTRSMIWTCTPAP